MVKQPLLRHTAHGFRLISPAEAEARMNGRILTCEGRRGTGRSRWRGGPGDRRQPIRSARGAAPNRNGEAEAGDHPRQYPDRRQFHAERQVSAQLHHAVLPVPTNKHGKPRLFFQDRAFVRGFLDRTGAEPGDTVLFEEVTPYRFRLSLRKAGGRVLAA